VTSGAKMALALGGVAVVGGLAYYLLVVRGGGAGAGGGINVGGKPTSDSPPPANQSPETSWGGRVVEIASKLIDRAPDIWDRVEKHL
jgi:hypothetical protein